MFFIMLASFKNSSTFVASSCLIKIERNQYQIYKRTCDCDMYNEHLFNSMDKLNYNTPYNNFYTFTLKKTSLSEMNINFSFPKDKLTTVITISKVLCQKQQNKYFFANVHLQ